MTTTTTTTTTNVPMYPNKVTRSFRTMQEALAWLPKGAESDDGEWESHNCYGEAAEWVENELRSSFGGKADHVDIVRFKFNQRSRSVLCTVYMWWEGYQGKNGFVYFQ